MPRHELETFYKATHNACRYGLRLPSPRMIQGTGAGVAALGGRGRQNRLTTPNGLGKRAFGISQTIRLTELNLLIHSAEAQPRFLKWLRCGHCAASC
jgi:hypothetical protein